MAEYFDVDPVIMRIIWVAAGVLTGGLAIPAYIVMWLIMPRDDQTAGAWRPPGAPSATVEPGQTTGVTWGGSTHDAYGDQPVYASVGSTTAGEGPAVEASASQPASGRGLTPEEEELLRPVAPPPSEVLVVDEAGRRRRAAGVLLIGLGVVFFAQQLGFVVHIPWHVLWPLAIVAVGVFILTRQGSGWRR
jgi:hypothetical protein